MLNLKIRLLCFFKKVSQDNIAKMISSNVGIDIKLNLFEKIQDFFSKLFN